MLLNLYVATPHFNNFNFKHYFRLLAINDQTIIVSSIKIKFVKYKIRIGTQTFVRLYKKLF